jgi:hypothetical protein
MQVAYLLFDHITALDVTGPHEVLKSIRSSYALRLAAGPLAAWREQVLG